MENSYGIGVRNRYELFYDDDVDPLDLLKKTEKRKKDKTAEKENKDKPTKPKDSGTKRVPAKSKLIPKESFEKTCIEDSNKGHVNQNGRQDDVQQRSPPQPHKVPRSSENRVKFSDREEHNNRRNKLDNEKEGRENVPPASQRFEIEGNRGRRGGGGAIFGRGGRGRRGRGGQFGEFRGKREFDRQSGMLTSGVKAIDKREGSGSFNWGSDKDQIEEQLQEDPQSDLDTSGEISDKPLALPDDSNNVNTEGADSTTPTVEEDAAPKDEESPKEMTLDEWKASQKRNKPQFNIRKAGEGENTAQWKKTYVLKKKEGGSGVVNGEEEYEEEDEDGAAAHGRRKVLLPIDFQFSDTPTRGRGRGRGRGGPGRGKNISSRGMRGSRYQGSNRQEAPRMDDERAFPSLG